MSTIPTPPTFKTTIILTNLSKDDFLSSNRDYSEYTSSSRNTSSSSKRDNLSFVDRIKLNILNLPGPINGDIKGTPDYYLNQLLHWSNLPFLSRVIIILKDECAAKSLYEYLINDDPLLKSNTSIKVTLQENLLSRSRSFDGLDGNEEENTLGVFSKFKNYYNTSSDSDEPKSPTDEQYSEPKPKSFNVYEDLSKMGIDLSSFNSEDQLDELKSTQPSMKPVSLLRTKSLTKTLFKPELKLATSTGAESIKHEVPPSPTITLDETF